MGMNQKHFFPNTPSSHIATLLLVACPPLSLYLSGAGSLLLYALLLLSVVSFSTSGFTPDAARPGPAYWRPLLLITVVLFVAIVVAQIAHHKLHASSLEKAARIFCIVPLVYFFCKLQARHLRQVQWGFVLATLGGAWALIFPLAVFVAPDGSLRPDTASFTLYNTVGFANLVMLFSTLTLASLGWVLTPFKRLEMAIKVIVALIGYYAVLMSQTRTSLLAVPVFLAIAFIADSRTSWRGKTLLASATLAILVVLSSSTIVKERIELARQESGQCADQPQTDSSVCIRFQLLRAATAMFKENPFFGTGDGERFTQSMHSLADRGLISRFVADHWGETHNDLSYVAATYGLVGLFPFIFAMYGMPAWFFVRHLRQRERACVTASAMGLIIVLGFLAFGLTEMMFRSMRTVSIYVALVGLMLALSAPSHATGEKVVHS